MGSSLTVVMLAIVVTSLSTIGGLNFITNDDSLWVFKASSVQSMVLALAIHDHGSPLMLIFWLPMGNLIESIKRLTLWGPLLPTVMAC